MITMENYYDECARVAREGFNRAMRAPCKMYLCVRPATLAGGDEVLKISDRLPVGDGWEFATPEPLPLGRPVETWIARVTELARRLPILAG